METETNNIKIQVGAKLDPALVAIIEDFRLEEDRSFSNMVGLLLKTHPRIQPILEAEPATAGAGGN